MADFGTNQNQQGTARRTQAGGVHRPRAPRNKTAPNAVQIAFTALIEEFKKATFQQIVIGIVVIGQVWIIYQLILPTVQNTQDTYLQYKTTLDQVNNERNIQMENRVKILEQEVASLSAR